MLPTNPNNPLIKFIFYQYFVVAAKLFVFFFTENGKKGRSELLLYLNVTKISLIFWESIT
jgi:hypothetical protein